MEIRQSNKLQRILRVSNTFTHSSKAWSIITRLLKKNNVQGVFLMGENAAATEEAIDHMLVSRKIEEPPYNTPITMIEPDMHNTRDFLLLFSHMELDNPQKLNVLYTIIVEQSHITDQIHELMKDLTYELLSL